MSSESPQNAANAPEAAEQVAVSLDTLKPKAKLSGVVKKVELQGAIVDVGLERPGLLHISQLSTESVKNVSDILKEGDTVTVYVLAVDKKKGRVDLTLIEPPGLTWDELKVNNNYAGKVVRIEKFGVFLDIGAERPGLIHVSELASGYVNDPSQIVKIGDDLEAKLIGVNRRKKQIDLSVRAIEQAQQAADAVVEDEPQEEVATAMEIALRRALQGSEEFNYQSKKQQKRHGKEKKRRRSNDYDQDDIIERTLKYGRS